MKTWIIEYYDIKDNRFRVLKVPYGTLEGAMRLALKCGCWPVMGVSFR